MFTLYVNGLVFGSNYSTREQAALHAYEIMLEGDLWFFEILPNDIVLTG